MCMSHTHVRARGRAGTGPVPVRVRRDAHGQHVPHCFILRRRRDRQTRLPRGLRAGGRARRHAERLQARQRADAALPGGRGPAGPRRRRPLPRAGALAADVRAIGGAFDVTVAPVVRLWRRARRERKLPDPELLARALALVGSDAMRLDPEKRTVELRKPGMKLDVGGIAKGYAAGEAIATLKRHGIARALVAAAGDIVVSGAPPDADGWTVAIAPLESPPAEPSVYLSLKDAAISTSGRRRAVRRDRRQALFPHRRPPDRPGRGRPLQRHRRRDRRRDRRQPGHGRLRPRTRARHGPRRRDPGRLGPDRTLDPRGHPNLRVEPLPKTPRARPKPAPRPNESPVPPEGARRPAPPALKTAPRPAVASTPA